MDIWTLLAWPFGAISLFFLINRLNTVAKATRLTEEAKTSLERNHYRNISRSMKIRESLVIFLVCVLWLVYYYFIA